MSLSVREIVDRIGKLPFTSPGTHRAGDFPVIVISVQQVDGLILSASSGLDDVNQWLIVLLTGPSRCGADEEP